MNNTERVVPGAELSLEGGGVRHGSDRSAAVAWRDWWRGSRRVDTWWTLAWFDIVLRYRRSMLGPFWLTLSMGAMIAGMGPLYSSLFGTDLQTFFPHLTLGLIFWSFFSSSITDCCGVFLASSHYLKQADLPISLFVWRTVARNLIQFAHHIVVFVPVAFWSGIHLGWEALGVIPAMAIAVVNAHASGLLLGLLCTKFRDVAQIVSSVMQMLMFLTPVFWMPDKLPDRARFVLWNPFAEMLDLLRTPLMGGVPHWQSWLGIVLWTTLNVAGAAWMFCRYRRRVVYWL